MGYGLPLPTWLVKNRTALLEGLSSLKLLLSCFFMCQNVCIPWLPPQGTAVTGTTHPFQRSDCWRKHTGSSSTACWGIHVFRWAGDNKAQTHHQMFHLSHPSKSLSPSCVLLDVKISQKPQAQTLHPVAWLQGNLLDSLSREAEPLRHSKSKGPEAWPRNRTAAGGVQTSE